MRRGAIVNCKPRDATLQLMEGLGEAGVALLLGELNRAVNELVVIDELRKAVDRAADNQHSGARGSS